MKVRAHTCYLGKTGYAAHSRSFFRELSKYVELRVRNYTWDPNPDYINNQDLSIVDQITLSDNLGNISTYPITQAFPHLDWKNSNNDFKQDIDIVLMEQNHAYFYEEYNSKIKIAYTVWESTLLENSFFRKLLEFDYLWVVTQWHKDCIIKQGFPSQRVFIVNEGVNSEFFKQVEKPAHITELHDGSFNFIFFNRWDYRKFAPEIISAFLKAFPNDEPVNLILSAENPYATDGFKTTSERLEHYGFFDERIKVKSFLERGDYVSWVKNAHVMITCARSEGWNIPLIEALASGTPALYSNWGAQLEFAAGLATPVKIEGELPANRGDYIGLGGEIPGLYCQPDKEDLVLKIRECYDNWSEKKEKALLEAEIIKQKFNWQKIGHDAFNLLGDILKKPPVNKYWFNINFVGGPFFSIDGYTRDEFLVEFIDNDSGQLIHSDKLNCGMWTRSFRRYYTNWLINVRNLKTGESTQHKFNLNGKKVLISIDSSSLGDSIAWFAPIQDFAKKHNCQIILSSFKNFLFKEQYPDIEFIEPGSYFENVYASYNIGWYYDSNGDVDLNMNPTNFRMQPLQKVTTDILGMDYIPTKPKLKTELGERPIEEPYVCFAIHSTAQAKYWNNPTGWQELTDYFISLGKKVVILSREGNGYMGNLYPIGSFEPEGGKDLENTMRYLKYCDIFVGVSSGLSWLSWAMNIPTVIISGFSLPFSEVEDDNVIRVFKTGVCNGCFNRHRLDSGDWNWCPDKKGTPQQFECSKSIKASDVIKQIEESNIFNKKSKTNDYDWGPATQKDKEFFTDEILNRKIYNLLYQVNSGDIVVDIGASTGIFAFSCLEKKPKHIFCIEPSKEEFPFLVKNTIGSPVTAINKAIHSGDGFISDIQSIYYDNSYFFETIKFSTFLRLYAITHINFLKTDCEGGEYHIFTDENIDFLVNNVDYIVGEWHLENITQKQLFINFRDNYLTRFKNFSVFSLDEVDIKWDLYNENFINRYTQIMIHIDNK